MDTQNTWVYNGIGLSAHNANTILGSRPHIIGRVLVVFQRERKHSFFGHWPKGRDIGVVFKMGQCLAANQIKPHMVLVTNSSG
jgi:hypothetical protein